MLPAKMLAACSPGKAACSSPIFSASGRLKNTSLGDFTRAGGHATNSPSSSRAYVLSNWPMTGARAAAASAVVSAVVPDVVAGALPAPLEVEGRVVDDSM